MQVRYVWFLVAALALIDVIAALVFLTAPSAGTVRGYFVKEDSLVENLTAGIFLCAFFSASILLANSRIRNRKSSRWLAILAVVGLIGFLDEISFGERLFDLGMPIVADTKIDAVHDVVELAIRQAERLGSDQKQVVWMVIASVLVLLFVAILKYGRGVWESILTDRYYSLYLVAFLFVLLGCSALILDTERILFRGAHAMEECFELNAAIALLASCFILYRIEMQESSL